MRTIPGRLPSDAPLGDRRAICSYCGVAWMRSQLRKDGSGNLVCPDEGDGLDKTTLARANARDALTIKRHTVHNPDGPIDTPSVQVLAPHTQLRDNPLAKFGTGSLQ